MDSLKVLRDQFGEKLAAHQAILAKPHLDDGDVAQAQTLYGELTGLKGRIESIQSIATDTAQLDAWSRQSAGAFIPPAGIPGAPVGAGTYANGVQVLGLTPAGEMILDPQRNGRVDVLNFDRNGQPDRAFKPGAFAKTAEKEYGHAWRKNLAIGWGNLTGTEQAVLQEGIDTDGGYLVPDEILNRVIQRQPTPTRVAGRVTRLTTSKDALSMPKVNYSTDDLYTTGMRVTWTGEVPASSTAHRVTQPVFGQVRIPIYTAMMSLPVTMDLIEDSTIDLMGWLSAKFGETIDLLKDNMILNGTGVAQPMGILASPGSTNHPSTVVTGSAAAMTGDGLINLTEAIPEQYDENSVLVFNKTNTGKAIRLLKDGDGRPLVTYGNQDNGLGSGRYRDVNGYPYIWSGFMPDVAANAHPVIFGDLLGYYAADRIGFSVQVLREIEAQSNQIVLLGRVRFGGLTAEEWRLRVQKVAAS